MTIIFHKPVKRPKNRPLWFEYRYTATGRTPPKGFQLRASVTEDPDVRIYEQVFIKTITI